MVRSGLIKVVSVLSHFDVDVTLASFISEQCLSDTTVLFVLCCVVLSFAADRLVD